MLVIHTIFNPMAVQTVLAYCMIAMVALFVILATISLVNAQDQSATNTGPAVPAYGQMIDKYNPDQVGVYFYFNIIKFVFY